MGNLDEASVPFLEHAHDKIEIETTGRRLNAVSRLVSKYGWMTGCAALLGLTNVTTFFVSFSLRNTKLDEVCALYTSQSWSPVLGDVKIKYSPVQFNGSLFHDTIYRQEAGPEVDAAWSALGTDLFAIVVPAREAERSGISLDRLRVGEEYGGPGYPAFVEGLHQLHCLNLLRQSLYFNHEYYRKLGKGAFANKEESVKKHIGHCLGMVRQALMCSADTGMQPFLWVGSPPHPFPDFTREHKCKNFGDILAFAQERQQPLLKDMDVQPHEGALILPDFP